MAPDAISRPLSSVDAKIDAESLVIEIIIFRINNIIFTPRERLTAAETNCIYFLVAATKTIIL